MWNKKQNDINAPVAGDREYSVLAKSMVMLGEIRAKDDFRVDGNIQGNIYSEGKVIIGPLGHVTGNIESQSLELMGQVNGDVITHDIVILKPGSILRGEVSTVNIEIEVGAQFCGNCKMNDKKVEETTSKKNKEPEPTTTKK